MGNNQKVTKIEPVKTYPCKVIRKIGREDGKGMVEAGEITNLTKETANKLIETGAVRAILE